MERNRTKRRGLYLEQLESRDLLSTAGWPSESLAPGPEAAEPSAYVASAKATPGLSMGSIVSGAITRARQRSQFTFKVTRETVVQFAVTGTAPNGFRACADIYDSRGNRLLTVEASRCRNYRFHSAGTYRLQMRDQHLAKTGRYTFGLERLSAPYSSDRQAIGFGSIVGGTIGKPIQQNQYTFKVTQGAVVQFALQGTAANGFLACADLYAPDGNCLLTMTADQCRNYTFHTAGTYVIQLHDQNLTKTGGYALGLEQLSAPYSSDKQAIGLGSIVNGTISKPMQRNQYTFNVGKEAVVQFALTGAASNGFLAWADLYAPDGNCVLTMTADQCRNYTFHTAGTYMIELHDQNLTMTGGYTLGLEQLSSPYSPDWQAIGLGSIVSGTIDAPIQRNQYAFEVEKEGVVQLAVTGADSDGFLAYADLYDLHGNCLLTVTAGQRRNYTFHTAGTYMIQIRDQYLAKTGSYVLALERLSAPFSSDRQDITFGLAVNGTIAQSIQQDQHTFDVTPGTAVQFTLTGVDSTGFRAIADVYDSRGNHLVSVEAGQQRRYTFNAAGVYMIQVHDELLARTGNYTLSLENA